MNIQPCQETCKYDSLLKVKNPAIVPDFIWTRLVAQANLVQIASIYHNLLAFAPPFGVVDVFTLQMHAEDRGSKGVVLPVQLLEKVADRYNGSVSEWWQGAGVRRDVTTAYRLAKFRADGAEAGFCPCSTSAIRQIAHMPSLLGAELQAVFEEKQKADPAFIAIEGFRRDVADLGQAGSNFYDASAQQIYERLKREIDLVIKVSGSVN